MVVFTGLHIESGITLENMNGLIIEHIPTYYTCKITLHCAEVMMQSGFMYIISYLVDFCHFLLEKS